MYDGGKIIAGLAVFLLIVISPVLYNMATGKASEIPNPVIATDEKQCVEPLSVIKPDHMLLLNNWRNEVVRNGNRVYVASDGKQYNISLTLTCLKCHPNKTQFCDECHNYTAVTPKCWDCHVVPEEIR